MPLLLLVLNIIKHLGQDTGKLIKVLLIEKYLMSVKLLRVSISGDLTRLSDSQKVLIATR